jgi:hypothetical protein
MYIPKKIPSASANAAVFGVPKMFVPRWQKELLSWWKKWWWPWNSNQSNLDETATANDLKKLVIKIILTLEIGLIFTITLLLVTPLANTLILKN